MSAQYLGVETVIMGQDAVPISQRLEQGGVRASHHVSMNVGMGVAVQFLYVLNVIYMPQEANPVAGVGFEIADERAAIVGISGNGQDAPRQGFLETIHD